MIRVGFLQNVTTWIFLPSTVSFLVSNTDAESDFISVAEFLTGIPMEDKESIVKEYLWSFSDLKAIYIRIRANNPGPMPRLASGSGKPELGVYR